MNSKLKQQWMEALRSGQYVQGCLGLRYGDTFDVMGVLLDLIDPSKWQQRGNYYVWADGTMTCTIRLPFWVNETCGIEVIHENNLVALNDSGMSFVELADWIESEIPDDIDYIRELEKLSPNERFVLYQGHWVDNDNNNEWREI